MDIRKYQQELSDNQEDISKNILNLFKFFSPENLLKRPFLNDANELNNQFYQELLHLMGLEEVKEKKGNKKIIQRKKENRHSASLVESIIDILQTEGMSKVKNPKDFGETLEEQHFNIALELSITWINRILFLKLLEGQLLTYHKNEEEYRFLNFEKVPTYQELFRLFHQVLAVDIPQRNERLQEKYGKIPYLNSSLFDISELEEATVKVHALDILDKLPFMKGSVIEDKSKPLSLLEYLFQFLDAYDFASEGKSDVRKDNKVLINASVLGKIFEKINGYKDGSVFTPSFITTYMCRQAIRAAVVEKFNSHNKWNIQHFDDLKEKIRDIKQANELINSLKICDPAVGSGHFLVSALNELIAIKSELDILTDKDGKRIRYHRAVIVNDELSILDEDSEIFVYYPNNPKCKQIQEALFLEKQRIIENCLFGVDINSNSVKICRLRLWIELLKSAYYTLPPKTEKEYWEGKLETFPNIDINIKCGNSLLSRFAVNVDLKEAFKSQKYNLTTYKLLIETYRASKNREEKKQLLALMNEIKREYTTTIHNRDPRRKKIAEMRGEIMVLKNSNEGLFGKKLSDEEKQTQIEKLILLLEQKEQEISDVEKGVLYQNGFEWRFEFPEVLNENGDFMGFDVIIGNPPYFSLSGNALNDLYARDFESFAKGTDIYCLFMELGSRIISDNGVLSLITSNKWLQASYGSNTRKYLPENFAKIELIDFDKYAIFEGVAVDTSILQAKKAGKIQDFICFKKYAKQKIDIFLSENILLSVFSIKGKETWHLVDAEKLNIKEKIEKDATLLGNFGSDFQFYRGITTGLNEAFILDEETKNKLIAKDAKNEALIKPILRGRDIHRYYYQKSNLYILNIHNGIKENKVNRIVLEKEYPSVFAYLSQFKTELEKRQDVGDEWYNLRNCTYWKDFEKEKIIFTKASQIQAFAYDKDKNYLLNTCYIATGKNLKVILGILNSKLMRFAFKNFYQSGGIEGEITLQAIEKLPIKAFSEEKRKDFVRLVNKVLSAKEAKKDSQTFENQIDKMIYELYDLTAEEIEMIEAEK